MGIGDRIREAFTPTIPAPYEAPTTVAQSAPANTLRPITASGEKINLRDEDQLASLRYRVYQEWQQDAWGYYDAIGEIKYGFGMLASVMSRVRLYSAFNLDPDSPPQSTLDYRRRIEKLTDKENSKDDALEMKMPDGITPEVMDYMEELVENLATGPGGLSSFLRSYALNMSVPGECYLVNIDGNWTIKSSDEIVVQATGEVVLKRQRSAANGPNATTSTGIGRGDRILPKNTTLIRIWREHPRFSLEPESSMLGLREACDELLTLQRMIRAVARSNMNAGVLFIPDSLRAAGSTISEDIATDEELSEELVASLYDNLTAPITDETNAATVYPTVVSGPAEAGQAIRHIELNRAVDQYLTERCDRALERVLQGIDMPKDFVTGLANVRYTNAKNIDESLYKSHIEPMVLMLVDALNVGYFKPALRKKFPRNVLTDRDLRKLTVWYDPSEIVTRADPAESANKGYDNFAISADAWRNAHGFADTDAPGEEEIALRLLQKAAIPPEMITAFVNEVLPFVTKRQRDAAVAKNPGGFPESANEILSTDEERYYDPPQEIQEKPRTGGPAIGDASSIEADDGDDDPYADESEDEADPALVAAAVVRKSALYNKPYVESDMQERYRLVAESAVRSFDHVMKTFPTSALISTQPPERTGTSGSGAGAKDLPPIVVKHEGKDYLLDGHHRAAKRKVISAAYVDLANLRTSVGKVV